MEELVQMAKEGNDEAFTKLILDLQMDMYKIAKVRLSNENYIDDAVQETIISVMKSIKKVQKVESFKSWIIKILINKCNTIYKKRKKSSIYIDEIEISDTPVETNNDFDNDMDFYLMLKGLNYKEKLIIILFYSQDYSIKEISKMLKMNENTVKTNMFRAKAKIKNNYIKEA